MNDLYWKTFDEIHASEALRQEVLNMTGQETTTVKRQVPRMLLIATVVVLVLAGTALAAAVPGIRQWFSQQWRLETGRPIRTDQLGLIDRLTDAVGASAESCGITVTVDSVTRGEDVIWFLLEIDGDLPSREELEALLEPGEDGPSSSPADVQTGCCFGRIELAVDPVPPDRNFGYSIHGEQAGSRADGSMMLLLKYHPIQDRTSSLTDALEITLELTGLEMGLTSLYKTAAVAEGPWRLTFSLPAIEAPRPWTTGGGQVPWEDNPVDDRWFYEVMGPLSTVEQVFRDIRVTPTGFAILWEEPRIPGGLNEFTDWFLILEDGTEVRANFGWYLMGDPPDIPAVSRYLWPVPLDLGQAEFLEFRHMEEIRRFALK